MTGDMRPCSLLLALLTAGCADNPPTRGPLSPLADGRTLTLADGSATIDGAVVPAFDAPGTTDSHVAPPPADKGTAPAPDTSAGLQLSADEQDLLQAVNAARAKLNLTILAPDPQLMCAARLAAKVCPPTGSCGHVGADGSWPHDRAESCGMSSTAAWKVNEIAAGPGFTDGADAVWGWSQSSGHWWGLTHPQATKIGVAATSAGCYWAVFDCCIAGS